jgi:hypothetical protein
MSVVIAKNKYPQFAAASGISGKRLVMYVNYGTGATEQNPVWNLVGGLTNNNLSLSAETNSAQTKDNGYWPISAITSKSYEVSAEVIMLRDNVAQEAIEAFMVDDEITAEKKLLNIAIVDLDTKEYYNLKVAPTAWEITAESEDMITKSFTATGSGAPVKASGFIVPDEANELAPVTFSKAAAADVVLNVPVAATITGLKLGTTTVDSANYSIALGAHDIVILGSYLDDLDNGNHTFNIQMSDSSAVSCVITVTA